VCHSAAHRYAACRPTNKRKKRHISAFLHTSKYRLPACDFLCLFICSFENCNPKIYKEFRLRLETHHLIYLAAWKTQSERVKTQTPAAML
jgi:hypothetical protein